MKKKNNFNNRNYTAENFYCIDTGDFGLAILMSKLVGENGKIFAFEPSKYMQIKKKYEFK